MLGAGEVLCGFRDMVASRLVCRLALGVLLALPFSTSLPAAQLKPAARLMPTVAKPVTTAAPGVIIVVRPHGSKPASARQASKQLNHPALLPTQPSGPTTAALTAAPRSPAAAADTSTWAKAPGPGGTVCFASHFHYGTSREQIDPEVGKQLALVTWSEFVSFEYGTMYADYALAQSKSAHCEHKAGQWTCTIQARPCRLP